MRTPIELTDVLQETLNKLDGNGILLVAGNPPNPMTIGWGMIGPIWGRTIFIVMVRPVRHTFSLMESVPDFSVCVLPEGFKKQLAICGTKSGRDTDKATVCGFHMERCEKIDAFYIAESAFHFECKTVHKHFLDPTTLDPAILNNYYPNRDFHMVYYGEIVGVYR